MFASIRVDFTRDVLVINAVIVPGNGGKGLLGEVDVAVKEVADPGVIIGLCGNIGEPIAREIVVVAAELG